MTILLLLKLLSTLLDPPPIDINSASESDLQSLPGIGPVTAAAIVEYRETVSSFLSVEELLFVPCVGSSTLESIHEFIVAFPVNVPAQEVAEMELYPPADTLLSIVFLDVGNGDAIALRAGDENWLIDGGPPGEGNMRAPVVQRLHEAGFDTLSTAAFTHPHADHIGGIRDAMEVFHCSRMIDPGIDHASPVYEELLQYALSSQCAYQIPDAGQFWELTDDVIIEVLWLQRGAGSPNEASAVYLVSCGDFSLMITGDIENETIMQITAQQLPVTVMKVPHHGSLSSLFPPWIRRTAPQFAVFCCGRSNPFGHPNREVVEAWERTGAEILRTDLNGNIFLYTDGESMTFTLSQTQ